MTFEKLELPTLKRVNLIGGKNNSGKTSLLEAIRIMEANWDSTVVNHVLQSRGAFKMGWHESYNALFFRENLKKGSIISLNKKDLKKEIKNGSNVLFSHGTDLSKKGKKVSFGISPDVTPFNPRDKVVYVPFYLNFKKVNELWDNIVLTPKENDVIKIISETVEPNLTRLDVGHDNVRIRLHNLESPVPIGTLGDGVLRILVIALSLANAQNSILLLDEIELGLHYSAMEKLWEIIFRYAKEWNIQVFATTHSQDAIKTFHYTASNEKFIDDAQYIRLQIGRTGKNEAIIYDGQRLKDSLELDLEIR